MNFTSASSSNFSFSNPYFGSNRFSNSVINWKNLNSNDIYTLIDICNQLKIPIQKPAVKSNIISELKTFFRKNNSHGLIQLFPSYSCCIGDNDDKNPNLIGFSQKQSFHKCPSFFGNANFKVKKNSPFFASIEELKKSHHDDVLKLYFRNNTKNESSSQHQNENPNNNNFKNKDKQGKQTKLGDSTSKDPEPMDKSVSEWKPAQYKDIRKSVPKQETPKEFINEKHNNVMNQNPPNIFQQQKNNSDIKPVEFNPKRKNSNFNKSNAKQKYTTEMNPPPNATLHVSQIQRTQQRPSQSQQNDFRSSHEQNQKESYALPKTEEIQKNIPGNQLKDDYFTKPCSPHNSKADKKVSNYNNIPNHTQPHSQGHASDSNESEKETIYQTDEVKKSISNADKPNISKDDKPIIKDSTPSKDTDEVIYIEITKEKKAKQQGKDLFGINVNSQKIVFRILLFSIHVLLIIVFFYFNDYQNNLAYTLETN